MSRPSLAQPRHVRAPSLDEALADVLRRPHPDSPAAVRDFYAALAETPLPFLPCTSRDPEHLYDSLFEGLATLGGYSIPCGVGLLMHTYSLAAAATFPLEPEAAQRRDLLLRGVGLARSYVATSGSLRRFQDDRARARPTAEAVQGGYRLSGETACMSLATVAKTMLLTARLGTGRQTGHQTGRRAEHLAEHLIVCFVPLEGTPGLDIGPPSFGPEMDASDTRSVSLDGVFVPDERTFDAAGAVTSSTALAFQRCWFQALAAALYLGAAVEAMSQLGVFSRSKTTVDGTALADSASFQEAFGELLLARRAAEAVCAGARSALLAADPTDEESLRHVLAETGSSKELATRLCRSVADTAARVAGTWVARRDKPLARFMATAGYGLLQPPAPPQTLRFLTTRHLGRAMEES